jgi:hypothetical protein
MQYELRDYQEQLINQIFSAWAEGNRRVMAQLSLGDWRYLAKHLGYKEGWAYKALQDARAVQLSLPI